MAELYAAGENVNLLERASAITLSPAVDSLFPTANLYDGRLTRPTRHGSNAANPSITFDLAAFAPQGAGTVERWVRAGERRRITSSGTTSITVQNLATKKFLQFSGVGWQTGSVAALSSPGAISYQVESLAVCQSPMVKLQIVITSGTSVTDWPRWNGLIVFGHQLDVGLVCEMRSSTDNFSGSNVLEATGAILQPGFVMWAPSGIASRYGRLLLTGTNQVIPWYACVMPCWLETALQAADIGYEEKTRESQVRNESDFGVVNVFNLTAGGRRSLKLSFRANSPGAAEIRNELVWRSRGGAYPAAIMPRSDEGSVYLGRFTDEWGVKRAFLETWDTDLFLVQDAVVAPLT